MNTQLFTHKAIQTFADFDISRNKKCEFPISTGYYLPCNHSHQEHIFHFRTGAFGDIRGTLSKVMEMRIDSNLERNYLYPVRVASRRKVLITLEQCERKIEIETDYANAEYDHWNNCFKKPSIISRLIKDAPYGDKVFNSEVDTALPSWVQSAIEVTRSYDAAQGLKDVMLLVDIIKNRAE